MKVTFVDFPGYKLTGRYVKYFLYATQGNPGCQNAMQARKVLFTLAKQTLAQTETDIEKAFTERGGSGGNFPGCAPVNILHFNYETFCNR